MNGQKRQHPSSRWQSNQNSILVKPKQTPNTITVTRKRKEIPLAYKNSQSTNQKPSPNSSHRSLPQPAPAMAPSTSAASRHPYLHWFVTFATPLIVEQLAASDMLSQARCGYIVLDIYHCEASWTESIKQKTDLLCFLLLMMAG